MKEILSGRICDRLQWMQAHICWLVKKRLYLGQNVSGIPCYEMLYIKNQAVWQRIIIIHGFTGLYVSVVMENSRSMKKNMTLKQEHGYLFRQKHLILSGIHQKQKILSVYVPLL